MSPPSYLPPALDHCAVDLERLANMFISQPKASAAPSNTTTQDPALDASAFPHLVELIFRCSDRPMLLILRGLSRSFRKVADRELASRHCILDGPMAGGCANRCRKVTRVTPRLPALYDWSHAEITAENAEQVGEMLAQHAPLRLLARANAVDIAPCWCRPVDLPTDAVEVKARLWDATKPAWAATHHYLANLGLWHDTMPSWGPMPAQPGLPRDQLPRYPRIVRMALGPADWKYPPFYQLLAANCEILVAFGILGPHDLHLPPIYSRAQTLILNVFFSGHDPELHTRRILFSGARPRNIFVVFQPLPGEGQFDFMAGMPERGMRRNNYYPVARPLGILQEVVDSLVRDGPDSVIKEKAAVPPFPFSVKGNLEGIVRRERSIEGMAYHSFVEPQRRITIVGTELLPHRARGVDRIPSDAEDLTEDLEWALCDHWRCTPTTDSAIKPELAERGWTRPELMAVRRRLVSFMSLDRYKWARYYALYTVPPWDIWEQLRASLSASG